MQLGRVFDDQFIHVYVAPPGSMLAQLDALIRDIEVPIKLAEVDPTTALEIKILARMLRIEDPQHLEERRRMLRANQLRDLRGATYAASEANMGAARAA